jgi:hypothetical protein
VFVLATDPHVYILGAIGTFLKVITQVVHQFLEVIHAHSVSSLVTTSRPLIIPQLHINLFHSDSTHTNSLPSSSMSQAGTSSDMCNITAQFRHSTFRSMWHSISKHDYFIPANLVLGVSGYAHQAFRLIRPSCCSIDVDLPLHLGGVSPTCRTVTLSSGNRSA